MSDDVVSDNVVSDSAAPALDTAQLLASARADAEALRAGPNPPSYLASLDRAFESAARDALADPALAERSLRLRRLARAVVPEPYRPLARRAAGQLDALARRYPPLLELGREAAALADGMAAELSSLEPAARRLAGGAMGAARRNPVLHGPLRSAASLIERSAASNDLPPLLRRVACVADRFGRRLRRLAQ